MRKPPAERGWVCRVFLISASLQILWCNGAAAQQAPSPGEIAGYNDLQLAAQQGALDQLSIRISGGDNIEVQDSNGRTPLHIAAFASQDEAVTLLADAGADLDAMDNQRYDIVTIAVVANDYELLDLALNLGASGSSITSPYEGTALIAAAHLGHYAVVGRLVESGAPLDHVNNLGWTALMEAVILGDGGDNHIRTVQILVDAGADRNIPDRNGVTPLQHATKYEYTEIAEILSQ